MPTTSGTGGGASLLFHLMLLFSVAWCVLWWMLTLGFLIFKAIHLPFPPAALPVEIVTSVLVVVINLFGVLIGFRGNRTESTTSLTLSAFLLAIAAVGAIYYMWLQTYILMLDLAFSAIFLGINALSVLLAFWAAQNAVRHAKVPSLQLEVNGTQRDKKNK
jgi:transmembrane protein 216